MDMNLYIQLFNNYAANPTEENKKLAATILRSISDEDLEKIKFLIKRPLRTLGIKI